MSLARVRQDGDHVQVIVDGFVALDVPYQAALDLAQAMIYQAKQIEEIVKRADVVTDQAILDRAGIHGVGLIMNKDLQLEAKQTALYDPKLRSYIPNGVPSQSTVGTPEIHNG